VLGGVIGIETVVVVSTVLLPVASAGVTGVDFPGVVDGRCDECQ
jgi:hypothetical protein